MATDPFDLANADAPAPAGGMSPDFWHNLMMFGGALSAGANARNAQGFLTYGPDFSGPFGAALQQTGQQSLETAKTKSSLASQGAATQGQQIQNQIAKLGLPLAALRARAASDPAFMQQMMGGAPQLPQAPQDQLSASPSPAPASGNSSMPFAANNPLNMRFAGQDGAANTNGFAAFPTPEAGQAATDAQFGKYADRGINTLRGLVSTWAPPTENNTAGYIDTVSKQTGIDPDQQLNLKDPSVAGVIQKAMAGVENNKNGRIQVAQAGGGGGLPIPGQVPQQGAAQAAVMPQQGASPQSGAAGPVQAQAQPQAQANAVPGQGAFSPGYITPQQAFQRAEQSRQQARQQQFMGFDATPATQQAQAWQDYGQKQLLQQTQPTTIRGPGSASISPATGSVIQSPLEYEVTGPDMRKYRITQNTIESNQPYVRPPGVPSWAPPGTLSVAQAEPSPGEAEGSKEAAMDAFGEKARSQYSSAAGTLRTMDDMEQQVDRLNAGGPGWYNTGAGAAAKLDFAKQVNGLAQSVGAPPIFDPDKLASGEDVTKQAKLAGMQVLSTMFGGSREAASIIHSTQAAVPNIENTPQGFKLLVNGYKEAARWQMDQHAFMTNWYQQHAGNMVGADVAFAQQNQPAMYTRRGISQVRPYEIPGADPNELKRFLPGTQVIVKADPTHTPRVIPGDADIPLQMPQQQPALGAPPQ